MAEPYDHLRITWFIEFSYSSRGHHGGMLRVVNFSRELIASGHKVNMVYVTEPGDVQASREYFQELQSAGIVSGFTSLTLPEPAKWKIHLSTLLLYPACGEYLLRDARRDVVQRARAILQETECDVVLLSSRHFYFLATALSGTAPCVVDMGDSEALYFLRDVKLLLKKGDLKAALISAKRTLTEIFVERYYGKRSVSNVLVSPVDQRFVQMLNGSKDKNFLVLNGVAKALRAESRKIPNQIVFSGNMDFPPNYESAIWLIDSIFPLVLKRIPSARLVIAGANPVPALKRRENGQVEITGFVEDLAGLISASSLYIAPMVSGSGFKNKVMEAIVSGTYVVSTPMGVEFLSASVRSLLSVASTAPELAGLVVDALENPRPTQERLENLQSIVNEEFSWQRSAEKLASVLRGAAATRRTPSPVPV